MVKEIKSAFSKHILFWRYALFGGASTLINLGLFYYLMEVVGVWYFYSAGISYVTGVFINFFLNKYFNFRNKSKMVFKQFVLFLIVGLIGLGLNQVLILFFVEILAFSPIISNILSILIVLCWNYFGHSRLSFGIIK